MKNKLLYLLFFFAGIAGAQTINFPDANFKARLLMANTSNDIARDSNGQYIVVDSNNDGEIQQSEALAVYQLNVSLGTINSLDGINNFQNLQSLNCRHNNLSSLTLSLPALTIINCEYNDLSSLDVSGCTNLVNLRFNNNQVVTLDASALLNLKWLTCNNNQLTNLNVGGLTMLEHLFCNNNQLSTLDVTTLLGLKSLNCSYNQLSTIDISALSNLTSLSYSGNAGMASFDISPYNYLKTLGCTDLGLTSLDLTGFTALTDLYCSNNPLTSIISQDLSGLSYMQCNNTMLSVLDLSGSPSLAYIHVNDNPLLTTIKLNNGGITEHPYECQFTNNPNLQLMCVDEEEADIMLLYFEGNEFVAPYMSVTCELIPGQVYNSMEGTAKMDVEMDGCDNNTGLSYLKLVVSDGSNQSIKFTNQQGEYLKYVGAGSFTVTPDFDNSYYLPVPAQATATFADMSGQVHQQDFCLTANGIHPDIEVILMPTGIANPGFDTSYQIVYRNKGNQVLSGNIVFDYDEDVLDFVSASAEVSAGTGSITWDYVDLLPFQSRSVFVRLNLNSQSETPPLNIDDELLFTVTAANIQGDEYPADNTFTFEHIVGGSYDPNNIICLEGATETPDKIGDYLHYVINFENIAPTPATFVVITNEIDTDKYDLGSLQILGSSHSVETSVNGNIIEFRFNDINLGQNINGNVVYKIKSKATLQTNDSVINDAVIVFDYNLPIITNDAETTFAALSTGNFEIGASIQVYPNPANSIVNLISNSNIISVELYDIQGRLLQSAIVNNTAARLDISQRASGLYFVKVKTEAGIKVEKIVKE